VRLVRDYLKESSLGDFVTDVMRERAGAEIAFTNAGGLRADLPEGPITKGDVLDALPFVNTLVTFEMTGTQVREVLEQGLTLERGLIQASGLRAEYDLTGPAGHRLKEVRVGDSPLDDARVYKVATNSFLAQGGDLYQTFPRAKKVDDGKVLLSDVVIEYLRAKRTVSAPEAGRLTPAGRPR
jgi:2',3'-cyclic-nucleotide 2'-phosphodiesterase/3'-nucleotidase